MPDLINGRTPEEIKRRMKCASFDCGAIDCDDCECSDLCKSLDVFGDSANALAYIQHLEAQQPKWISVEERLPPPETERYLVACVCSDGDRCVRTSIWAWDDIDEKGDWINWDVVTHWMPLPEPPEAV